MIENYSWKAVIKPEDAVNDLVYLAGQWNTSVDVKINIPHQISQGPVRVKMFKIPGNKRKHSFSE
ncbi:MAG: hypothetical protein JETT_2003 [Candidatus Jettenia ecosi]|uniref:Uncharacterized protein n=1 Tax=Candidatus Jettenia ecosi TaxID=2494326 RepID=A0A533QAH5_9BACT|nr:MAG: hypothetical protein JETT_2003 [Candidatus Jettenia ecosi]